MARRLVVSPAFVAFHARFWNGRDYGDGALFTVRLMDGEDLKNAGRIGVFHAFGSATFPWQGKSHDVRREEVLSMSQGEQ